MSVLKEKYVQYIKFLFGGSKYYVGRSLAEVHANLRITDEQFDDASDAFLAALQKFKPRPKKKVFIAMTSKFRALKPMIVIPRPDG